MIKSHKREMLRIKKEAEDLKGRLEILQEEMQEIFDEMTERVQEGARGEKLQEEIEFVERLAENLAEFEDIGEE